ncbi:MAG: UDP-glucose/GDP-mannose dehydrogenase family protein [Acidimicrobiaceae bacterium]|nr:UDP-glucose/GDP-mannose dehydrogenase family protein [Acidimicrobiaceae bacterium]
MHVSVIGSGYVGTVAAACFASVGHDVVAVEADKGKLAKLRRKKAPFYEPGLDDLLAEATEAHRLSFTDDFAVALERSEVVFICVGTPARPDGQPDMEAMEQVAREIGRNLRAPQVVVTKSTVPIGTGRWLRSAIEESLEVPGVPGLVEVASSPEFLREGQSVSDFLRPDRIVVGCDNDRARDLVVAVYEPIVEQAAAADPLRPKVPILRTGLTTAEMIKYASNAFLATKISFANEMARICDLVGADITEVTAGMGFDARIGNKFLNAGLGWGGSCFGKDILALIATAEDYGYQPRILAATLGVNGDQRHLVIEQLQRHLKTLRGLRVGVLGLVFKPGTDDLRDSAALDIIDGLTQRGAIVTAHDPMVHELPQHPGVRLVGDPYEVADGADAIVLATEWPDYLALDLVELRRRAAGSFFLDGRNVFRPERLAAVGFHHVGIGRGDAGVAAERALATSDHPDVVRDHLVGAVRSQTPAD